MSPLCFYFFVALIASANSLKCACPGCGSPARKTAPQTICWAETIEYTLDGFLVFQEFQNYIFRSYCYEGIVSVTMGKGIYLNSNTNCCNTDNCNAIKPAVLKDTTVSKLECPSCFAVSPDVCIPVMMKCAESENYCINITGNVYIGSHPQKLFSGRGCATHSAIVLQPEYTLESEWSSYVIESSSMRLAKSRASWNPGSIPLAIALPSLAGTFFTRFLY